MFKTLYFTHAVFTEEDLLPSSDYLSYFTHLREVMKQDSSVICGSSWNDNGFNNYVKDISHILRGLHFMSLGFILSSNVYNEILLCTDCWVQERLGIPHDLDSWEIPFIKFLKLKRTNMREKQTTLTDSLIYSLFEPECLYPEISRSHHLYLGTNGWSTTKGLQTNFFDIMAYATGNKYI
jgi:hypothetical protein